MDVKKFEQCSELSSERRHHILAIEPGEVATHQIFGQTPGVGMGDMAKIAPLGKRADAVNTGPDNDRGATCSTTLIRRKDRAQDGDRERCDPFDAGRIPIGPLACSLRLMVEHRPPHQRLFIGEIDISARHRRHLVFAVRHIAQHHSDRAADVADLLAAQYVVQDDQRDPRKPNPMAKELYA